MAKALGDRSARVDRIERWLRGQTAPILRWFHLDVDDGDGTNRVRTWDRHELGEAWDPRHVAEEVDDLLLDMAAEQETRVRGRLSVVTETENAWTSFVVQADSPNGARTFEASSKGVTQQAMKHHEALAVSYLRGHNENLEAALRMNDSLLRIVEQRDQRQAQLELENMQLKDELARARQELVELQGLAEQALTEHADAIDTLEQSRKDSEGDAQMAKVMGQVVTGIFQAKKPDGG